MGYNSIRIVFFFLFNWTNYNSNENSGCNVIAGYNTNENTGVETLQTKKMVVFQVRK